MDIKIAKQFFKQCCTFEITKDLHPLHPLESENESWIFKEDIASIIHDFTNGHLFPLGKIEFIVFRFKGVDINRWRTPKQDKPNTFYFDLPWSLVVHLENLPEKYGEETLAIGPRKSYTGYPVK